MGANWNWGGGGGAAAGGAPCPLGRTFVLSKFVVSTPPDARPKPLPCTSGYGFTSVFAFRSIMYIRKTHARPLYTHAFRIPRTRRGSKIARKTCVLHSSRFQRPHLRCPSQVFSPSRWHIPFPTILRPYTSRLPRPPNRNRNTSRPRRLRALCSRVYHTPRTRHTLTHTQAPSPTASVVSRAT